MDIILWLGRKKVKQTKPTNQAIMIYESSKDFYSICVTVLDCLSCHFHINMLDSKVIWPNCRLNESDVRR